MKNVASSEKEVISLNSDDFEGFSKETIKLGLKELCESLVKNSQEAVVIVDLNGRCLLVNKAAEKLTGCKEEEMIGSNVRKLVPRKYWPLCDKMAKMAMSGKPVLYLDKFGRILDVNKKTVEVFGGLKRELLGKHFTKVSVILPRDLPMGRSVLAEVLAGKETGLIICIENKKGQEIHLECSTSLMKIGNKFLRVLVIAKDVTERKKTEERSRQYSEHLDELVRKRTEELLESEKRYSVLVEEARDGVAIFQDRKLVFTNKRGAEIFGHSRDELVGLPLEKLFDEKYRQLPKEICKRVGRRETIPEIVEAEVITKTGEPIPTEFSGSVISHHGRPALLVVIRDIRERKRMEEQRLKLQKLATIGELATMVAHDLRNPLTSIRNASFYIKNTCPSHENKKCKNAIAMLDIIEQETLFANNIVNDLLDFAAKRPLQKKRQNINKLIETSLKTSNMPDNIRVKRKTAKKATATIDGKQLERVFLNLIKNAVQAMPNGGKLTITTIETKDHIEITFTDTGVGVPQENLTKIFAPLFTTKAKGIGMGLAICEKIVKQHGGTINMKSKVGQGTTLMVKLPKKEEADKQ